MGNEQSKEAPGSDPVRRKRYKSHDSQTETKSEEGMRVTTATKRRVNRVRRNQSYGPTESQAKINFLKTRNSAASGGGLASSKSMNDLHEGRQSLMDVASSLIRKEAAAARINGGGSPVQAGDDAHLHISNDDGAAGVGDVEAQEVVNGDVQGVEAVAQDEVFQDLCEQNETSSMQQNEDQSAVCVVQDLCEQTSSIEQGQTEDKGAVQDEVVQDLCQQNEPSMEQQNEDQSAAQGEGTVCAIQDLCEENEPSMEQQNEDQSAAQGEGTVCAIQDLCEENEPSMEQQNEDQSAAQGEGAVCAIQDLCEENETSSMEQQGPNETEQTEDQGAVEAQEVVNGDVQEAAQDEVVQDLCAQNETSMEQQNEDQSAAQDQSAVCAIQDLCEENETSSMQQTEDQSAVCVVQDLCEQTSSIEQQTEDQGDTDTVVQDTPISEEKTDEIIAEQDADVVEQTMNNDEAQSDNNYFTGEEENLNIPALVIEQIIDEVVESSSADEVFDDATDQQQQITVTSLDEPPSGYNVAKEVINDIISLVVVNNESETTHNAAERRNSTTDYDVTGVECDGEDIGSESTTNLEADNPQANRSGDVSGKRSPPLLDCQLMINYEGNGGDEVSSNDSFMSATDDGGSSGGMGNQQSARRSSGGKGLTTDQQQHNRQQFESCSSTPTVDSHMDPDAGEKLFEQATGRDDDVTAAAAEEETVSQVEAGSMKGGDDSSSPSSSDESANELVLEDDHVEEQQADLNPSDSDDSSDCCSYVLSDNEELAQQDVDVAEESNDQAECDVVEQDAPVPVAGTDLPVQQEATENGELSSKPDDVQVCTDEDQQSQLEVVDHDDHDDDTDSFKSVEREAPQANNISGNDDSDPATSEHFEECKSNDSEDACGSIPEIRLECATDSSVCSQDMHPCLEQHETVVVNNGDLDENLELKLNEIVSDALRGAIGELRDFYVRKLQHESSDDDNKVDEVPADVQSEGDADDEKSVSSHSTLSDNDENYRDATPSLPLEPPQQSEAQNKDVAVQSRLELDSSEVAVQTDQEDNDDDEAHVKFVEQCENCLKIQNEAKMFFRGYMLALRREEELKIGNKWALKQRGKQGSIVSGSSIQNSVTSSVGGSGLDPNLSSLSSDASVQELRDALNNLEDKYKKSMVQNAQLDNERTQLVYQTQQLRDLLEEQDDEFYRLKKEHREKCQEVEKQKRLLGVMNKRNNDLKHAVQQRDELIQQQGVVLIGDNTQTTDETDDSHDNVRSTFAIVTPEAARLLEAAGDGPLDARLKHLAQEIESLQETVKVLRKEANERDRNELMNGSHGNDLSSSHASSNINEMQILEIQREANKLVSEYKVKIQKSEQDVAGLQANVTRLETQLQRHKQTSEMLEKNEDEMRAEKRRLQRDLRTALDRIEEHELTITHLERRLDRARAARGTTNQT